jgi:chromosome partitioning protein
MKKPVVISICTAKGGVGKTTTTMALSECLASKGYAVLVIDADYQTSCTVALIGNQNWEKLNKQKKTIVALVEDAINEGADGYTRQFDPTTYVFQGASNLVDSLKGRIDLLPSSPDLAKSKKNLYKAGKTSEYDSVSRLTFMEWGLRDILQEYDFVLIDTHPDTDDMLFAALYISDYYLMPVIPDAISSYGIVQMYRTVHTFSKACRRNIKQLGVLFSMVREVNVHRLYLGVIKEIPGVRPFETMIRLRAQVTESIDYYNNVNTLKQKYGSELAEDYAELTEEVISRCQEKRP